MGLNSPVQLAATQVAPVEGDRPRAADPVAEVQVAPAVEADSGPAD